MGIDEMKDDRVTIKIPRVLYERLKKAIEGSSYRSVNEFIVYVLRDLVATSEVKSDLSIEAMTKEEIERIKEKLRSLGYL